ncbi:MAG: oligosaccharide flippase family protein, partial [Nanoarchaeota archaeon]
MVDYSKKLIQGTAIVLIFSIVSTLIGYIFKLVLAKTTSISDIGLFFSVLGLISAWSFFRDLGLSDALIYYIPRFLVNKSKAKLKSSIIFTLLVQILIGTLFFFIMILFSKYLAQNYFKDGNAYYLVIFLSFYFIIDGIHEVLLRIFHGYQNIFFQQAFDFCFQTLSMFFILLVIFFKKNIIFFGVAYILADLIAIILFFSIFIRRLSPNFFKIKTKIDWKLNKKLLKYSLPVMVGSIAESGFYQQTIILLTFFVGLEAVGYYVMVRSIAKLSLFIYKASGRVFMPMISELWKRNKFKKLNFLFNQQIILNYLVAVPLTLSFLFFSEIVLRILYGENFVVASLILKVFAIYVLFELFNNLFYMLSMST